MPDLTDNEIDIDLESVPPGFNLDPIRDGDPGDDGRPGARGPRGLEGARGAAGENAPHPRFEFTGSVLKVFLNDKEIAAQDLKGAPGEPLEFGWQGTTLQMRQRGQEEWHAVDLKGEQGERGLRGEAGVRGLMGIMGMRGATGPRGSRGSVGEKGLEGAAGVRGARGPKGEKGDKGDPPKHELSGDKKKIRFEQANGSWGEWLDFEKMLEDAGAGGGGGGRGGAMGPPGERGPAGIAGVNGLNGIGVPPGGLEGQILMKISDDDFDTAWMNNPFAGYGSGGYNENGFGE